MLDVHVQYDLLFVNFHVLLNRNLRLEIRVWYLISLFRETYVLKLGGKAAQAVMEIVELREAARLRS